jgi:peptide deformylase
MAMREILKYPDPRLRTEAGPVEAVDDEIQVLIDDMIQTMYCFRGIGLAAIQVGVAKRVIVLDVPEIATDDDDPEIDPLDERGKNVLALVNPEITFSEGTTVYEEGCLSVPGVNADVQRAAHVKVEALDRDGNKVGIDAEGLLSIVLQHEIDHLNGILFIDRLSRLKRELVKRKLKKKIEAQDGAL